MEFRFRAGFGIYPFGVMMDRDDDTLCRVMSWLTD